MKPLKLTMTAFGPYVDSQTVDFADLGARSLFLIHGPTGAGKTSILDAMCFALFGETSGGERSPDELRSQHASASLATSVEFDFAVGVSRYRIARQPSYQREKARGGGTTLARATANLWQLLPGEEKTELKPLAATPESVTKTVQALLGLGADEFRRVVVLPQGKFREFLNANTKSRESILATLFRTDRFRRLQDFLKFSAKRLEDRYSEVKQSCQVELQALGVSETAEIAARIEVFEAENMGLDDERLQLVADKASCEFTLAEGREVARKLAELDTARKAWAQLDSARPARVRDAEILERARRAQACQGALGLWQKARDEEQRAQREWETAQIDREKCHERFASAEGALAREVAREPERDAARARIQELRQWVEAVGALAVARQQAQKEAQLLNDLEGRLAQARQRAEQAEANVTRLQGECLRESEAVGPEQTAAATRLELAERHLRARALLEELRTKYRKTNEEWKALAENRRRNEQALSETKARLRAVEEAWGQAAAHRLATLLQPGRPCPVCGSSEHPTPAQGAVAAVDDAALRKARAEVEGIEVLVRDAIEKENSCRVDLESCQTGANIYLEQLGAENAKRPLSEFENELTQARVRCEAVARRAAALASSRQTLATEESRSAVARRELQSLESDALGARNSASASQARLDVLVTQVPLAFQEARRLESAITDAQRTLETLKASYDQAISSKNEAERRVAEAEKTYELRKEAAIRSELALAGAHAQLHGLLGEHGFADVESLAAALLPAAEISALEARIREFDSREAQLEARLRDTSEAARGLEAPALGGIEERIRACGDALSRLDKRKGELAQLLENHRATASRLEERAREMEILWKRYGTVGRLAELARGDNTRRLTLQVFVLQTLLDDVLHAASTRLRVLSRGRYLLRRAQSVSDGRSLAGLDLEVHDEYTGQARSTASLSGGEGFLASLALALALSDVVQQHAGGVRLDTVFVDEGFGALDPESLDMAMNCLASLQAGGRLVGVISHVPELVSRIDARLEVRPDPLGRGSRVRFVVP